MKKIAITALSLVLPLAFGMAQAQSDYPQRPITLVVPFSAGGDADVAARNLAAFAQPVLGNDERWNAEYQIQLREYGKDRTIGCELEPTRYDQVAVAFGGHGEQVTRAQDVLPAAQRALASGKPACLNVMIEGVPAPSVKQ